MKARVKATGEIVEVHTCDDADFQDRQGRYYWEHQLYFGTLDDFDMDEPDYWERLKHQYAGMAMQGMLTNEYVHKLYLDNKNYPNGLLNDSIAIATALVEKLKEKEERK